MSLRFVLCITFSHVGQQTYCAPVIFKDRSKVLQELTSIHFIQCAQKITFVTWTLDCFSEKKKMHPIGKDKKMIISAQSLHLCYKEISLDCQEIPRNWWRKASRFFFTILNS